MKRRHSSNERVLFFQAVDESTTKEVKTMSSEGAKRGFKRETLFVNLIKNNEGFRENLEKALSQLNICEGEIVSAKDVKRTCKADVKLQLIDANGRTEEIGCSIKAAEANFNQLDRRWLSDWGALLQMPEEVKEMIQSSLNRKMRNSREIFILPEQESAVFSFLESKKDKLLKELFMREDENLQVFVAFDEKNHKWYVSSVEDIIDRLKKEPLSRTNRGVVNIGDCLSLQRKGGDGNITRISKDSPHHPSNQLQFKIKPLSIIKKVPAIEINE